MKIRLWQVFGIFKVRETGNKEYWFSQLVVLASTIIGVYLAAQAGYKTAVEFEVTRSERDGYYLRRTLLAEIKRNIKIVDQWGDAFEKKLRSKVDTNFFEPDDDWLYFFNDKGGWNVFKAAGIKSFTFDGFELNSFVWDTMKEQFTTFQLPADLISTIQSYYNNTKRNIADFEGMTDKSGSAAAAIVADTKHMRNYVVKILESDIARLRARLESKHVELN